MAERTTTRPRAGAKPSNVERMKHDPIALAIRDHARAMTEVAAAIRDATAQRKPADEFFGQASARLDHLCMFLRKRGPWLLGSAPLVLMGIGAITPNAAEVLSKVLMALGVPVSP